MVNEQGEKRRYIPGNQRVDLVVYQSLMALSFLLGDSGDDDTADAMVAAANSWLAHWQRMDDRARAAWYDHYEELTHIQATLALFGVDGPVQ